MAVAISALPVVAITQAAGNPTHASPHTSINRSFRQHFKLLQTSVKPPTDSQCRTHAGVPCYSPQEIRKAYGVMPLLNNGFTGQGQTIVIIDSFGSPTIQCDLKIFDSAFGLPDPPSFTELAPLGKLKFNPQTPDMIGWAAETSLDVEWSHAMAPAANIVLMTSPVDETQGVQGMPEFLFLEQYAVNHNLGKIISQSWATTENTLFSTPGGRQVIKNFNTFYQQADRQGVTIFGSSGDAGVANPNINGKIYPFPTVNFPASSPFITAVGGTSLFASTQGNYHAEVVWNGGLPSGGATGGGISRFINEPNYQLQNLPASDQSLLNGHRGLPDIAFNADPGTGVLVFLSFPGVPAGWYIFGGTSEGSPTWAGITADGNQMAGRSLGFLNPALYVLGNSKNARNSFHDITTGNNSQDNIQGFSATPGWDVTTGWGTPKAANLLQELIKLT
jgi:subtilase family serine protease